VVYSKFGNSKIRNSQREREGWYLVNVDVDVDVVSQPLQAIDSGHYPRLFHLRAIYVPP